MPLVKVVIMFVSLAGHLIMMGNGLGEDCNAASGIQPD